MPEAESRTWLTAQGGVARSLHEERGLPRRKSEDWKYSPTKALASMELEAQTLDLSWESLKQALISIPTDAVLVFANGRFAPELSRRSSLHPSLSLRPLSEARAQPDSLGTLAGDGLIATLNTGYHVDGAVIEVEAQEGPLDDSLPLPTLHLVFACGPGASYPRVLINAGPDSRALIVEHHVQTHPGAALSCAVTEIDLAPKARLERVLVRDLGAQSVALSLLAVRQGFQTTFHDHALLHGAALGRNQIQIDLDEEGASCTLNGLYITDGSRHCDNHTTIHHHAPNCRSDQLYKGIVRDSSHGVFTGRVEVDVDAQGTQARQRNPNLLLSESARVDTRPQLVINADDVQCSHGATTGQIDADALFYLRSRGLSDSGARDLLTYAFANEVLNTVPVPGLVAALSAQLAGSLGENG